MESRWAFLIVDNGPRGLVMPRLELSLLLLPLLCIMLITDHVIFVFWIVAQSLEPVGRGIYALPTQA